jgi:hypothetical protein
MARRRTEEEKKRLIITALELCPDCVAQLERFLAGRSLVMLIRHVLWRWLRLWPHAEGCPVVEERKAVPAEEAGKSEVT